MKYRKLRIAWSVWWGVVAVLSVALWVRAHFASDALAVKVWQFRWDVCSSLGTIGSIVWMDDEPHEDWSFNHYTDAADRSPLILWLDMLDNANYWIDYVVLPDDPNDAIEYLVVRCWVLPVLASFAAALPWLPFRFSLRTLLIATTLIAVLLGLIVWMA